MRLKEGGFTLLEMLVVMGLTTVMMGIAVINLKKFDQAASNAANQIASLIKGARSYGMTSTVTVQIAPVSSTSIQVSSASSCGATTRTTIPELSFSLPDGASLSSTSWSLCYTSRGLSRESLNIVVNDRSIARTVQVTLGGGVRVL